MRRLSVFLIFLLVFLSSCGIPSLRDFSSAVSFTTSYSNSFSLKFNSSAVNASYFTNGTVNALFLMSAGPPYLARSACLRSTSGEQSLLRMTWMSSGATVSLTLVPTGRACVECTSSTFSPERTFIS